MLSFDLSNRIILITGAAKGIGRQAALDLASAGATLILTDIDEAGAQETLGMLSAGAERATVSVLDVTDAKAWQSVITAVRERHGRLDVLVNNAGVILNRPFSRTTLDDFQRVMRINAESVFMGCQAALPLLMETAKAGAGHGGSIINLSSVFGMVAGPMQSAYCASKGAVRMLSKALAVELAPLGIRVNSVHPGPTNTDLGRSGVSDAVHAGMLKSEEVGLEMVKRQFPMGRWGEVDDISSVIAFLASDASKFMTGTELTIDGGFTAQ